MRTKLENRCLEFGVGVIKLVRNIGEKLTQKSRDQLISSATSIGANVAEARSAESRADFIHKLEIALKEARETDYWLTVLYRLTEEPTDIQKALLQECFEITAMLVSSVKTSKENRKLRDRIQSADVGIESRTA